MTDCPGHFGHIELAKPVFHPGFLVKIKKVLESVCCACGKVKGDEDDFRMVRAKKLKSASRKFKIVHDLCKYKIARAE